MIRGYHAHRPRSIAVLNVPTIRSPVLSCDVQVICETRDCYCTSLGSEGGVLQVVSVAN
jgi:hypothetical protein